MMERKNVCVCVCIHATVDYQANRRYPQRKTASPTIWNSGSIGLRRISPTPRSKNSLVYPSYMQELTILRKLLKWTDPGARLVAEFNSKVCSPYMFVDVSPSSGLETEGRVPDGVVSPSSGPDMQGLLYVPLVSDRFRQFNSFVQQSNRHTRVAGLH